MNEGIIFKNACLGVIVWHVLIKSYLSLIKCELKFNPTINQISGLGRVLIIIQSTFKIGSSTMAKND